MDKTTMENFEAILLKFVDVYERLETTDEVTDDNPAFDFICDISNDLFNTMWDYAKILDDKGSEIAKMFLSCIETY